VQDALRFIERHALFTRQGRNGVRQVNVRGLVAAAFTHRDSRAGDPDLHTHVAVANKVQTLDGRWLSIDGRCCSRPRWRLGDLQHRPWNSISAIGSGCGSRIGPTLIRLSGRYVRSSVLTRH
jgi:TrwC relaxase